MKKIKSCAIRGREYAGKPRQIEIRKDDWCNCLTSLLDKDCMVLEIIKEKNELQNTFRNPGNG